MAQTEMNFLADVVRAARNAAAAAAAADADANGEKADSAAAVDSRLAGLVQSLAARKALCRLARVVNTLVGANAFDELDFFTEALLEDEDPAVAAHKWSTLGCKSEAQKAHLTAASHDVAALVIKHMQSATSMLLGALSAFAVRFAKPATATKCWLADNVVIDVVGWHKNGPFAELSTALIYGTELKESDPAHRALVGFLWHMVLPNGNAHVMWSDLYSPQCHAVRDHILRTSGKVDDVSLTPARQRAAVLAVSHVEDIAAANALGAALRVADPGLMLLPFYRLVIDEHGTILTLQPVAWCVNDLGHYTVATEPASVTLLHAFAFTNPSREFVVHVVFVRQPNGDDEPIDYKALDTLLCPGEVSDARADASVIDAANTYVVVVGDDAFVVRHDLQSVFVGDPDVPKKPRVTWSWQASAVTQMLGGKMVIAVGDS